MEAFFIYVGIILSLPFLAPDEPKTTVILLDNNLSTSAIDVTTKAGVVTVDKPYTYTKLVAPDQAPLPAEKGDEEQIKKKYQNTLSALPDKAVHMLFYFEQGTADLTPASKEQVSEVIKIIEAKEPASVDIIGHSDRAGDADKNYQLALKRAESVKTFLLDNHVKMDHVSVVSYGENDPLIPTEDGVAEPQNRRVEVIVR